MIISNKSILIPDDYRDKDERGDILSIVDAKISNVSIIKCNPLAIRSNHYHKTDAHFMYVLCGEIDYFYKKINEDKIFYYKVKKGQNIFTPPLEIHATYFPVYTEIIVSSLNPRDQQTYENDTVRVSFIDNKNIKNLLERFN